MPSFDVVVRQPGGDVQTLHVQAADAASARRQAPQSDEVLYCHPRKAAGFALGKAASRSRHGLDITSFSYELASLMAAGLSVVEALRTLVAKEPSALRRAVLLDVVQGVTEGLTLSTALARPAGRFPALLVATVSASEQTGDLGTSLKRYAEHQQSVRALRDKVVGAAIYPMLLLGVGCLVVVFLLGVVVPKFALLIESTRKDLPWSSQLMMNWGRFAAAHAWAVGGVGLGGLIGVGLGLAQVLGSGAKSRWIESMPLIGRTLRQFRHAQLYRTTGMLVKGGIAAPRALQLGASLLGNADQLRLATAVTLIHEGLGMSQALREASLADPVATSMLAVAERTGALADVLERIAQFHESSLQRNVELASRLFEPLLMIVIGLVIGGIVVLMYLPIFDLASSLQ